MEAAVLPASRVPRSLLALPLATLVALMGFVALIAILFGGRASGCSGGLGGGSSQVPKRYAPLYAAAASRFHLGGQGSGVLAAIHKTESGFGAANHVTSSAGAVGHMQFLPSTWAAYGVDANGDAVASPYEAADAIFAAARYLRASGAPGEWHGAIFAYNHSESYVAGIRSLARRFSMGGPSTNLVGCAYPTGNGDVEVLAGANRPGVPLAPATLAYLNLVSQIVGIQIRVGTGSNHSEFTVGGLVSDHWDGHAADIPMTAYRKPDSDPLGDRIMAACLIAGGTPPARAQAEAQSGGLYTLHHAGLRIQCIWKTYEGGDHYNHVHIGARPA